MAIEGREGPPSFNTSPWLPYVFGFLGLKDNDSAKLRCTISSLSLLGLRPHAPSTPAQSKERTGSIFAIWQHCLQAAGNDSGSLWQDPLFLDPATHNYALAEASPARDLGIEQIEVDNVGVQSIGKYHNK